ncbi:MAG TPA: hypothetical protein VI111_05975, partial [Thermoleophilaceae bacterium]
EGPVLTDGHDVQASSDAQPRRCDATNNGAHPEPRATPTAASVDAMTIIGETFDGDWYPGFDDYFITSWGPDGQFEDDFAYWGVLVNGRFTSVGGCQYADDAGDEVLWAYDAFNSKPFLRLAAANDPSVPPGPTLPTAFVDQGQPLALDVRSYTGAMDGNPESIQPVPGASVAPVETDPVKGYQQVDTADPATVQTAADGSASITFATPGWHRVKADKLGMIRSNRLDVCVRAPGESGCGPLPADVRVRSIDAPDPDPDPTPVPRSGEGTPTPLAPNVDPVRLSAPVVGRDWARGRVTVRWKVLDAGVGVRSFALASKAVGAKRWTLRASGTEPSVALKLPAGVASRLRLTVVDALGRSSSRTLGSVLVPRDERSLALGRGWAAASDSNAWAKTVSVGGPGATARVRLGAGQPVVFVRGVRRAARVELSGAGKREVFRIAASGTAASRAIKGARRSKGTLTVRVLSGKVGLDGVALAP